MQSLFENEITLGLLLPFIVALYFLPTIVAMVLNRAHKKQIFMANLPAGLVWTLWFGVLIWAITGKQKQSDESGAPGA